MTPLLRAVLRLLPGEFQAGYRADLEATVRAQRAHAGGRAARFRLAVATVADVCRVAPGLHADIFRRDLQFAWRALRARPMHTMTAVLTLALGLGAAIAIFAVLDAVWLQPLPYRDPGRLVTVGERSNGGPAGTMGYLTFVDLRAQSRTLAGIAAAGQSSAILAGDGGHDAERLAIMRASSNYLEMIGVAPSLGRWFTEAEDRPGAARREVILSDRLWRRRFNADRTVISRPIALNGIDFIVVGVMPQGFDDLVATRLYNQADAWTPLGYDPAAAFACRTCRHLQVFARLAPGQAIADANRELSVIIASSAAAHPKEYDRPSIGVAPLADTFFRPIKQTLVVLGAGVVLLLLVACGNVSNLLLLRATERKQEIAVRTALGGTTSRLARQLMTESVLLALAGGLAAWPVALALSRFLVSLAPPGLPRLANVALDARVATVALGLTLFSAVLFGLAPMLQVLRGSIADRMQGGTRHTERGSTWTLRAGLVAGNVAMAAILLAGSGLLIRSLAGLLSVELGFSTRHVLTSRLDAGGPRFTTPDNRVNIAAATTLFDDVLTRVRALPGVQVAAAVTTLPLSGNVDGYGVHVVGRSLANPESAPSAQRFVVTPGFAETLGIKLVRGRLLDDRDRQGAPAAVVINEKLAREVFAGEDPLGHQVALGGPDGPPRTIVGIVGDIRDLSVDQPAAYEIYVPQAQWAWAETDLTFVVRATGDPSPLASQMRAIVKDVDASQPLTAVELYDDIVAKSTATRRVAGLVIALFAIAALTLAIVGLVGALGVVARQRSREIGVRMALGANAGIVATLIIKQGMRPAILGLLAGLGVAAASAGTLRSLLYGVNEIDPITFAGVAFVLSIACVCACAVPAWRASHTDVVGALRTP